MDFTEAAERVIGGSDTPTEDTSPATADDTSAPADSTQDSAAPASEGTSPDLPTERRGTNGRYQRTVASTVPYTRFNEVTKQNQTYKADLDKLKTQFGWMADEEAPKLRTFYETFKANPVQALARELRGVAGMSPQAKAQIAAELKDLIEAQAEAKDDPEPGPDFQLEGTEHKFFSEKQQREREAWLRKQMLSEVQKELAPLKQMEETMRLRELHGVVQTRAVASAKAIAEPLLKNPVFQQHKAAIGQRWTAMRQAAKQAGHAFNGETALYRVFAEVLAEAGNGTGRQVATSLQQRASATALNPRRPAPAGTAKPPTTFREAAERRFGLR